MEDKIKISEQVEQFIEELEPDMQEISLALRNIIFAASSKLTEEYKWSMPNYSLNGLVCYLQPAKKHVNLGFHKGNELENKEFGNLLQGTGKTMRHIRIKKLEDIQTDAFTSLIKDAIKLNEDA